MTTLRRYLAAPLTAILVCLSGTDPSIAQPVKLQPKDHICIVGNTLAERLQHDGWFESFLHARLPEHDLTIRNLGYSGDEITVRLRSQDFGTPDQWLSGNAPIPNPRAVADLSIVPQNRFEKTQTRADVIFAFFGYNEAWAGKDGLPKFTADLTQWVKHVQSQNYSGKSAPRVVLFSPIAFENHHSPNLPDGVAINANLLLYTRAMAEVAEATKVGFIDLYHPTLASYGPQKPRFTINGIHLNSTGNNLVAEIVDAALFPAKGAYAPPDPRLLATLRPAVQDKAFHWYQRYRVTDGYSIFGGRAWLKFTRGQTNYEVVQRELEILDILTSNRDKVVWAAAKGKSIKADDSNLPKFIDVPTNKPGRGPNGDHLFLSGKDAIKSMTVGKGLKVNLFADESMFPELANPVQAAWDPQGRLWVAVWPTYPHWKPTEPYNDKLLVLEDTNNDGVADKVTVFADNLQNPTGFEFYNGGVIVAQAPDLMFLKDTNGDGKADVQERIVHGLDTADTHHTANSFATDGGGAIYFQEGTFHHSQVEDPYGPAKRVANGAVFRYEPRTQRFEVYVSFGFANPHGHVFDRWGQDIVIDGTGAQPYHAPLFSGHLPFPQKHARPPQVYAQRTRPSGGMEYLSSRHFPPEFDGNLIVTNCIGFQGVLRYQISESGGSLAGKELEPILSSTDPHFRPVDAKTGPDGALYIIDWHNPIIGHMQHNLRDPSRDRSHGRIYRVTAEGRQLSSSPTIHGAPISDLLNHLKHPEDRVRYRARIELGGRKTAEVISTATQWLKKLDPRDMKVDEEYENARLEILWLHQSHNVLDVKLLSDVLKSPDFRARSAAVRVAVAWRDKLPDLLEILKTAAGDDHPRVRVEAVRGASFLTVPEAIEVPLIAADRPADSFVDHVRGETMKVIDPMVKKAIADKRPIRFTTAAGSRYFLKAIATDDLVKLPASIERDRELLFRPGVRDELRATALSGLAKAENKPAIDVLLNVIRMNDQSAATDSSVAFDLVRLMAGRSVDEVAKARPAIADLAVSGKSPITRQLGLAALIAIDGKAGPTWDQIGVKSVRSLQDLVAAVPMIRDVGSRMELYPKIESLLKALPSELGAAVGKNKSTMARYIRIELPGKQRTLTLAEVEIMSDGVNVARGGKATQINTAHNGPAGRAIDGNKSGTYADGGQTHTEEGIDNPWWEVDLGREYPVEKIIIYNRTDGNLGTRLANFTVKALDGNRGEVYKEAGIRTPAVKAELNVGTESAERIVRRSAMLGLTTVRGKEGEAFRAVSKFVADPIERSAAVRALLRIPTAEWPKEGAQGLLDEVIGWVRRIPVDQRTSPEALDAMQFAESLTGLLPGQKAREIRKELRAIGVSVVRVGTLTDQMLFDKDRIVIQAGRPVEFLFENTDIMPHNFVIVRPGSLEQVGMAAENQATQPGALERHYIPTSMNVMLGSKLLQPRDSQRIRFTAPTTPGVYPYVCTYPGHWRRMYGALYVVEDLDAYLDDPEGYLTKSKIAAKDELLKFLRPRKEWKFEELAGEVEKLKSGRSFAGAKQMFQVANCISCHKMAGAGQEFGPDLTKLDPKVDKPIEIWRHIVDPSVKVDEKYQVWIFETKSSKVITGMIVEQGKGEVKIIENPLAKSAVITLKDDEIESRRKSANSLMPKNLLDKLTKEEILDLIAYIIAKGSDKHPLFQGGHDHHH